MEKEVDRRDIETKTDLLASASCAATNSIQRSGIASSSIRTNDSSWSILQSTTVLNLNPWDWYLSCRMARIVTVEPVIFLYMFGNLLFTTLTQQYYFNRYAGDIVNHSDSAWVENGCINISNFTDSDDIRTAVESRATLLAVYCSLAYRLLSLLSTLFLGPLSDFIGRRPIMIIALVGAALQAVCAVFVVQFDLNLHIFILSFSIAGITGGLPTFVMSNFSYISDVSSSKWRTVRIGIGESMIFLAGVLSTGFGGWWFKHLNCNLRDPLFVVIACNVAAILFILVLIPHSMHKEQRKIKNKNKKARGFRILVQGFKILFGQVEKYRPVAWIMWATLIPMLVVTVNLLGSASVRIFFLEDLNWSPTLIGAQVSLSLASRFIVLAFVLPVLVALKMPDPLIALVGAVFNLTMNLFMGLSHKTYQVFIVALIQGMDGVFFPPLRGLLSKLVTVEDQGALFSLISSSENLGMLVGEVAFPLILPISLKHHLSPGMTYVVMAGLGLVPLPFLCILLGVWCRRRFKAAVPSGKIWDYHNVNTATVDNSEVSALLSASVRSLYDSSSTKPK